MAQVDDHVRIRLVSQLIKAILTQQGYSCSCYLNLNDALLPGKLTTLPILFKAGSSL